MLPAIKKAPDLRRGFGSDAAIAHAEDFSWRQPGFGPKIGLNAVEPDLVVTP
jgi:hypothetical protein